MKNYKCNIILSVFFQTENCFKNKDKAGTMAQTCNPTYSGGKDQEDHSLRPAQTKSSWDPISANTGHGGTHLSSSYGGKHKIGGSRSRLAWAKNKTVSQKSPTQKRAGWVIQVVERLPSKCEAPSSNPAPLKEKETKKIRPIKLYYHHASWKHKRVTCRSWACH
jgi:hypothetical protein